MLFQFIAVYNDDRLYVLSYLLSGGVWGWQGRPGLLLNIFSGTTALCGPWPSSEAPAIPVCSVLAPPIPNSQCPYVLSDTVFPSHLRSSNFPGLLWPSLKYLLHCSLVTSTQYMSSPLQPPDLNKFDNNRLLK